MFVKLTSVPVKNLDDGALHAMYVEAADVAAISRGILNTVPAEGCTMVLIMRDGGVATLAVSESPGVVAKMVEDALARAVQMPRP